MPNDPASDLCGEITRAVIRSSEREHERILTEFELRLRIKTAGLEPNAIAFGQTTYMEALLQWKKKVNQLKLLAHPQFAEYYQREAQELRRLGAGLSLNSDWLERVLQALTERNETVLDNRMEYAAERLIFPGVSPEPTTPQIIYFSNDLVFTPTQEQALKASELELRIAPDRTQITLSASSDIPPGGGKLYCFPVKDKAGTKEATVLGGWVQSEASLEWPPPDPPVQMPSGIPMASPSESTTSEKQVTERAKTERRIARMQVSTSAPIKRGRQ
jgi:hypothetical protein